MSSIELLRHLPVHYVADYLLEIVSSLTFGYEKCCSIGQINDILSRIACGNVVHFEAG
jgi:hypothetical protein